MTPQTWYAEQRAAYRERYGRDWTHLSMWEPNQSSEVCETALRSGVECHRLAANGPDEVEMVANAVMIRDYLHSRRNDAR